MNNCDMPAMPVDKKYGYSLGGSSPNGLSKREYFAGLAMQGLLSGVNGDSDIHDSAPEWCRDIVESSVEFADALLAELANTK